MSTLIFNFDHPNFVFSGNKWYVDTMVSVILVAGDFVAEPVWHRVVMIVTNNIGKIYVLVHFMTAVSYDISLLRYSIHDIRTVMEERIKCVGKGNE